MKDYHRRMLDEKSELDGRIDRLKAFIETDLFHGLPAEERSRMGRQCYAMTEYSKVLGERIEAIPE